MTRKILVTGGTGNLGKRVVPLLLENDAQVRTLGRRPQPASGAQNTSYFQGDTVKGVGLTSAMSGMDVVLHLAGGAKGDDVAARHVAEAATAAGVGHLVLISVVGADRMPIGYFRAKAKAEQAFADSAVPFTILRAAQFHDFVLKTIGAMEKLPLTPLPRGLRFEPVDVTEVAARLAELTLSTPQGRVRDIAGPEVLDVRELLNPLAKLRQKRLRTFGMPLSGGIGRAYRAGDNLAGAGALRGTVAWSDYLVAKALADGKV